MTDRIVPKTWWALNHVQVKAIVSREKMWKVSRFSLQSTSCQISKQEYFCIFILSPCLPSLLGLTLTQLRIFIIPLANEFHTSLMKMAPRDAPARYVLSTAGRNVMAYMVDKLDTTTIFYRTLSGLWKGSCMKSIFRNKIPLDHPVLPFSRNNEASENRCWGGGLGAGDCSVRFHHNRCQIPLSGAVPWERFLSLPTLAVTEIYFWIKLIYLPPCFMLRQPKRYLLVLDQKKSRTENRLILRSDDFHEWLRLLSCWNIPWTYASASAIPIQNCFSYAAI